MGKKANQTTVLIPEDLKEWARENGINMSFVLRKRLTEMREKNEVNG